MQSYAKAVKWYRLSVAQGLGTASMNLGYCYLRGKGLPADKEEALWLFRLAVEQGEPRAQPEVERLDSTVTYGSIPTGFKDRTKDGGGIALIGGTGSPHSTRASNAKPGDTETSGAARTHSEQGSPSRLRFIDVAEAGEEPRFMGLIVLNPKKMDDEASYCRQVEQVQKIEAEAQAQAICMQSADFRRA